MRQLGVLYTTLYLALASASPLQRPESSQEALPVVIWCLHVPRRLFRNMQAESMFKAWARRQLPESRSPVSRR